MEQKQPEALRLADALDAGRILATDAGSPLHKASAELRRLHALNAELLEAARLFVKYDCSPDDDGVEMMIAYNNAIEAARAVIAKATGDARALEAEILNKQSDYRLATYVAPYCQSCCYANRYAGHGECWTECRHPEHGRDDYKNILWGIHLRPLATPPEWCPLRK